MAYFDRLDETTFGPTGLVSGGWDPDEQHNLAASETETADRLREKLIAWRKTVDAKMPTVNSNPQAGADRPAKKNRRQRNRQRAG